MERDVFGMRQTGFQTANLLKNDGGVNSLLTKTLRMLAACLLLTLVVSSVAVAAPMTSNQTTMPHSYQTGVASIIEVPEGKSPVTGLDFDGLYRPMVVQISNSAEARPHWNLSEADIVYESIYWGPAHTRYTAIYNDNHPDYVGSIRSARVNHCEIRQEWDAPFVYFGGQEDPGTSILDYFKQQGVERKFLINGILGVLAYRAKADTNYDVASYLKALMPLPKTFVKHLMDIKKA